MVWTSFKALSYALKVWQQSSGAKTFDSLYAPYFWYPSRALDLPCSDLGSSGRLERLFCLALHAPIPCLRSFFHLVGLVRSRHVFFRNGVGEYLEEKRTMHRNVQTAPGFDKFAS
jgi:hypothetical protein